MMLGSFTDIRGLRVGHATDPVGLTGCTVVLCERGAVAGVDVRGSACGTRELAALAPGHLAPSVHGLVLSGGSAFGLDAACGVVRYLETRGAGLPTPNGRVPIVVGAILYDLGLGDGRARPDAAMGYAAARAARTAPVEEGSVGAGTGATVGKMFGTECASKGGVGTASIRLGAGVLVTALVVVNAYGDVVDPRSGAVVAGTRLSPRSRRFIGTSRYLLSEKGASLRRRFGRVGTNTTLAVVATNAKLTKLEATKVATIGHDGFARAISPCHTMGDGDVTFCLGMGSRRADVDRVGLAGATAIAEAALRAVRAAWSLGGVPAISDMR